MKKLLLTLLACLFTIFLFGQNTEQNITVKGLVTDSVTNKTLGYVTILLQDSKIKSSVKSTLTKDDGTFELSAKEEGNYQLALAFVGYKTKVIAITSTGVINLGIIPLSPSASQLNEVAVTAVKPLMKQEIDRMNYDVQADPDSKTFSALEMMRKVPMISVDGNDNIKLRGSGSYKILINGKESALMANNPSDVLKSMPGTNIVKIEVITTPPAKYDAEGLAGIINIITQKKVDQGYNGSINTSYNIVYGPRLNLSLTVKEGKFGYNGYVGYSARPYLESPFDIKTTFYSPINSSLAQNGYNASSIHNTFTGNDLSFELDSLNLFTATFNFNAGARTQSNNQLTEQRDANSVISQAYQSMNNGTGDFGKSDIGINYQRGFKSNKNEFLTASYRHSNETYNLFNEITFDKRIAYNAPNYKQNSRTGAKENTMQLDYINPLKVLTIEAGGKIILRTSYSNFGNDLLSNGIYIPDPSRTNNFTYHQNVYSVYNSYQLKFAKWTFKGGLRVERTAIDANFLTTGSSSVNQLYNSFVPSFSAQKSLNPSSNITFGFTQRIQRPGITQLNPFIDLTNPKYVKVGNPALKPAVNNTFELSYGNFAKGSVNVSAHYSFANNTIQNVISVDGNAITTTTYANVGQNRNLGLDLNANYPITQKMDINVNASLQQIWLKGTYNGSFYTNSGQQGYIFTTTSYKFDDGYRLSANIGFDSRYVMLQGRDNYWFDNTYSVSKDLFKKKATISFTLINPFSKYNKIDIFTSTPDFNTYNKFFYYYRTANISFNYKFGGLKSNIKKNKRGINNDDAATTDK